MRLRKLDFLRGIAIILVLFHHYTPSIDFIQKAGWIGVDLFFVLSGFLVSGLLFREWKSTGEIQAGRFFIRRGFKIYPMFYAAFTGALILYVGNINKWPNFKGLVAEVLFFQNYVPGFMSISWSLAVEEHFYILLLIYIVWQSRRNMIGNVRIIVTSSGVVFSVCLAMRLLASMDGEYDVYKNLFPTHLRLDSLTAGVLISYFYHFQEGQFMSLFRRHRVVSLAAAFILISPAFVFPVTSFIMHTFGLTCLYVGFGLLLCVFIANENTEVLMDRILTKPLTNVISRIGEWSYGIYLWHFCLLVYFLPVFFIRFHLESHAVMFVIYFFTSVFAGWVTTLCIERPALKARDKYFPSTKRKSPDLVPIDVIAKTATVKE